MALRVGVHFTVVRRWWREEFGTKRMRVRGQELQKKKTRATNVSRGGERRNLKMVTVVCERCGETFKANRVSLAKRQNPLCDGCRETKKNPVPCPVCKLVCEGNRGLATHFRHCRDEEGHATYEEQQASFWLEGLDEGADYVTCQICGFKAKSLSSHIRTHDVDWVGYARKFPGSSLWSERTTEHRSARLRETHARLGFESRHLTPFTDENGLLVVAAAAKGLGVAQDTVRRYAKALGIVTRNRLAEQKRVLDLVAKILNERHRWEWSDDRIRNPETGALLFFDGFFRRHNLIVEYHGPQHFQFVPRWHRTAAGFDRQQETDRLKARRASELGFEMVVVRHTDTVDEESLRKLLNARVSYKEREERIWVAVGEAVGRLRKMPFPYPERPAAEEAQGVLEKLRRIRQRLDGGIIVPRSYTGNALCRRYFPNIYRARRRGHPSAVECWRDVDELRKAVRTQVEAGHPTTPERVLKALTFHHHSPAVFRPAFARFVYERFCAPGDLVWDPCAGYGGRLFGAAAAGVRYLGTDIEPETVEGNRMLARDLGFDAEVRLSSALDAEVSPVGLVFTSTPYFDVEQYSDREGQPHVSYDGRDDWLQRFLKPFVEKAGDVLRPGGRLVLVLSESLHVETQRFALDFGFHVDSDVGFELPNGSISRAVVYLRS